MISTCTTVTATCNRCKHSVTFQIDPYDRANEVLEKKGWDWYHNLCPKCVEEVPAVYACWYYDRYGRQDRLVYVFESEELAKAYCSHDHSAKYEKIRLYDYQHWEERPKIEKRIQSDDS